MPLVVMPPLTDLSALTLILAVALALESLAGTSLAPFNSALTLCAAAEPTANASDNSNTALACLIILIMLSPGFHIDTGLYQWRFWPASIQPASRQPYSTHQNDGHCQQRR